MSRARVALRRGLGRNARAGPRRRGAAAPVGRARARSAPGEAFSGDGVCGCRRRSSRPRSGAIRPRGHRGRARASPGAAPRASPQAARPGARRRTRATRVDGLPCSSWRLPFVSPAAPRPRVGGRGAGARRGLLGSAARSAYRGSHPDLSLAFDRADGYGDLRSDLDLVPLGSVGSAAYAARCRDEAMARLAVVRRLSSSRKHTGNGVPPARCTHAASTSAA